MSAIEPQDRPHSTHPGAHIPEHAPHKAATVRALLVAIVLSLLIAAWTKQAELVSLTSQISESTPPIASILALFFLLGVAGLLGRAARRFQGTGLGRVCARLIPNRGEILVIFIFLAITAAMPGVGLFRQVMPCLMVTQYFGMPQNHLDEMASHIPPQWAPNDPEVARVFWEGSDTSLRSLGLEGVPVVGPVLEGMYRFLAAPLLIPWRYWAVPFLLWSAYLSTYFVTAFAMITLFRRYWEEDERLTYPVSSFAVEMISPDRSVISGVSFFRDPVMWIGFSLAILYNVFNALKVFNPAVPALGISYPLGQFFTERPWNTMNGFAIFYKPEILGLGYLVPSDVLFSIWFFTIANWVVRPFALMSGYEASGFPFMTQQAMGAFILLGGYFIWQARHRLADVAKKAWNDSFLDDSDEPLSYRVALPLTVMGIITVITMPIAFGVAWWQSLMYFGIMFLVLLVYCRNRSEMGFPIVWGYPLYEQRSLMINFLGSGPLLPGGQTQSFTLLTMFSWLQRSVNQAITSIGTEGYVAGHRLGESRRTISRVVIFALIFGLMSAFLLNLSSYYEYGGLVLSSPGGTEGGQMTQEVLGQFNSISQWVDKPEAPNPRKISYTIFGSLMALGLILGRRFSVRFPFHPGGYALALSHGGPYMWFPALLLWLIKSVTLHIGGIKMYRRLAPGFLAFTLGHFFAVGLWSLVGLFAGEFVQRYTVWFL